VAFGVTGVSAARPQLIRALNERVLLDLVRREGPISRADLARRSGLSKPTVSLTLSNLEADGLVRPAGIRTGNPGRAAILYEIRPEAGLVLALDVGRQYLRGALSDLGGGILAKDTRRARVVSWSGRIEELVALADSLLGDTGVSRAEVTQTVIGSPGVYDPSRDSLVLARSLPGWERASVLAELRSAFGESVVVENDVDLAALAERAHGHGRDIDSFAFVSIGTGIGMGLVIGGRLHRGAHRAAGEIAYLPLTDASGYDERDARRRGKLEAAASAAAVARAARRAGLRGPLSARRVFAAAERDPRAAAVVSEEAELVAKAICAVVAVADPQLVVLGGGIGQAPGFADAVTARLRRLAPVQPEVRVSALGPDAVVDGCVAAGLELAWELLAGPVEGGRERRNPD
jgi:predicted NBD/HSP70 family sugar kinase